MAFKAIGKEEFTVVLIYFIDQLNLTDFHELL
jgi:hypothetical protein